MSQQTVTSREIIKLAREKYPNLSLSHYVGDRLRKLKKWGFVDYEMYTDKYFRSEQRRKVHNIKHRSLTSNNIVIVIFKRL